MRSYEHEFFLKHPSIIFEKADKDVNKLVAERHLLGLIVDKDSQFVVTLTAVPLITCNAYVFSYKTYGGFDKVIIYHANSNGPILIDGIAARIKHETELSTVSIIIATPGNDQFPYHVMGDMDNIGNDYSEKLMKAGFTNKIQILFNCSYYRVNSKGQHGERTCETDLIFNELPKPEIKDEPVPDSQIVSICSLL